LYYKELVKNLPKDLKELIGFFGLSEAAEILGESESNISAFRKGSRDWSIGKQIMAHDALMKEKNKRG